MFEDPKAQYKRQLAMSMMAPRQAPTTAAGGISNAAQQIAGALIMRQAASEDDAKQKEFSALLAQGGGKLDQGALLASDNPFAQQLGTKLAMAQAMQQEKPETFSAQTVAGPGGKPQLAMIGNRGTIRPVDGYSPYEKPITAANGTMLVNPATGQVTPIQGAQEALLAQRAAGRTRVNNNVTMPDNVQFGSIPPGHKLVKEGSEYRMEAIPGSPEAREIAKEQEAAANATAQEQKYANVVTQDIDRILGLVEDAELPVTGFAGSLARQVPGTAAHDVAGLLDSIESNVSFNRLQEMRKASPTGGALGAVSERELALLSSSIGSLKQSQSEEQFVRNLKRANDVYLDIIHGKGNRPGSSDGGGPSPNAIPQMQVPAEINSLLDKYAPQ